MGSNIAVHGTPHCLLTYDDPDVRADISSIILVTVDDYDGVDTT